ncbi:MAG TPA: hypothetical protein VFL57_17455 [Bryobacteraceae bacterium]|nr:hypothetical protein [Bryobacteraceae bacterium]
MPSQRQLNANRRNAALGGPKTPEGRAAVRFNALRNGLAAVTTVVPGEDPKAFEQLREDLFQDYLPATHTETVLFEEFARCSWRLLRLRRVETEMWSVYILGLRKREGADQPPTLQEADRALAGALAELPPQNLTNFFRYERTITRDFYRALHELEAAQRQRRRGESVPASTASVQKPQNELEPHSVTAAAGAAAAAAAESDAAGQASASQDAALSEIGIGTVLQPSQPAAATPGDTEPQQLREAA